MFVYQPTFSLLKLKEDMGTNSVIGLKSKGVYNSKSTPLHTAFLRNIKLSRHKIGMQFNKSTLVVEQSNYKIKIVNA